MAAAATACELLILAHSTGKGRPAVSAAHAGHDRVVSVHDTAARGAAVSCVERREMVVHWLTIVSGRCLCAEEPGSVGRVCARCE